MIKIIVHLDPDVGYDDVSENYTADATFTSNEDSTVDDIIKMLVKAMEVDGYFKSSMVRALGDAAAELQETIDLEARPIESNVE